MTVGEGGRKQTNKKRSTPQKNKKPTNQQTNGAGAGVLGGGLFLGYISLSRASASGPAPRPWPASGRPGRAARRRCLGCFLPYEKWLTFGALMRKTPEKKAKSLKVQQRCSSPPAPALRPRAAAAPPGFCWRGPLGPPDLRGSNLQFIGGSPSRRDGSPHFAQKHPLFINWG